MNFLRNIILAFALLVAGLISASAASRFAVCTTTCTWDGASTAMWSASSGGATGASVPGSSDTVTLDAATCVGGTTCAITVNTNFSIISLTMGACTASTTGCVLDFSVNNNSPTLSSTFSATGTGVRTLKLGSGTFSLTVPTGTSWDMSVTTNLTFPANSATIDHAATATGQRTFIGGGLSYNNVSVTNSVANNRLFNLSSSNTFANLTFTNVEWLALGGASTQTITGAFAYSGATNVPAIFGTNSGTAATLSVANATVLSWLSVSGITKAGAGSITANNSFDLGNNTGVTINNPAGGGGGRCIGC